jgi:cytochrome c oxidase subunit II
MTDHPHDRDHHDHDHEVHTIAERFERGWMVFALAMLVVFTVLIFHAILTHGQQIAVTEGRQQPSEIFAQERFAQPGVRQTGSNQYEVSVVVQSFAFLPTEIRLPEGAETTFYITSRDVIHGYQVQDTTINFEIIPGEVAIFNYTFREPGEYRVICNQYCGTGHHNMLGMVVVESREEIIRREAEEMAAAERGELEARIAELTARLEETLPVVTEPGRLELSMDELPAETRSVMITVTTEDGRVSSSAFETREAIESLTLMIVGEEVDVPEVEPEETPPQEGEPAPEVEAVPEVEDLEPLTAEEFIWPELGAEVYTAHCASCHQAEGQGIPGAFPPLAGHLPEFITRHHVPEFIEDDVGRHYLINVLLYGLQGAITARGQTYDALMPAFGYLSDQEIAAVLNHTLHAWGNDELLPETFVAYVPGEITLQRDQGLTPLDVYEQRQELELE